TAITLIVTIITDLRAARNVAGNARIACAALRTAADATKQIVIVERRVAYNRTRVGHTGRAGAAGATIAAITTAATLRALVFAGTAIAATGISAAIAAGISATDVANDDHAAG